MTSRRKKPVPPHLTLVQITTRVSPESAKLLAVIAAREHRTLSSQLVAIVEAFLAVERKKITKAPAAVE